MSTPEITEVAPVDIEERHEEQHQDSYESKDPDKLIYTGLSAESQMAIDRTVESTMHTATEAIASIQEFGRQARDAESPGESAYAFTLEQKYAGLLMDAKNALAAGKSVEAAVPNKEDLEAEIKRDLESLQHHVEKAEAAHKAEVEEAERNQQAQLNSSQHEVTQAYEASVSAPQIGEATPDRTDSTAPVEATHVEGEDTHSDTEKPKKLGYFEKRRQKKAIKVYGEIDRLSSSLENSQFAKPGSSERAQAYSDALDRLYGGDYAPNGQAIKGGEKFLQELKDAELRARQDNGSQLSKEDLKRLKKLK